jgi:hypothetical protein
VAGAAMMLATSIAKAANAWPSTEAGFLTAAPLQLQVLGVIAIGLVGLSLSSALVGLAFGSLPQRMSSSGSLPDRDALRLGIAAGLFAAAMAAVASLLRTPVWARMPDVAAAGTIAPMFQTAIDPITRVLLASAVMSATLLAVDRLTSAWTRRRVLGILALAIVGFLAGGVPVSAHSAGWVAGSLILALALVMAYVTLLRFDLTLVPLAVATMTAVGALAQGARRAYPGALPGSLAAVVLVMLTGWWWFRAIRSARPRATDAPGVPGHGADAKGPPVATNASGAIIKG